MSNSSDESIKVLLVDDDSGVRKQVKIFLEKEKEELEVETVDSAKKALNLMEEDDFDVIVSDYRMPGKDGLDFLKTVREDRESDIPFIILTGKGDEEVAMKAVNLGANRYLQKRGDPKSQCSTLAQLIVQEVELKEAQEKIAFRRNLLRSLLNHIPDRVYFKDKENKFVEVSESLAEQLGVEQEEMIGKTEFDFYPEEHAKKIAERDKNAIEEEEAMVNEVEKVELPNRKERWMITTRVPRYDQEGNVIGCLGIAKDFTKQWVLWRRIKERGGV